MSDELTHTEEGRAQMVDVGDKATTKRRAVAAGELQLKPATITAVKSDTLEKGDVLATARIGAVQAVKHTWSAIPLCHQIPITNVETDFTLEDDHISLTVAVETIGQTGCEMEALHGVTTGLAVIWDMVKAAEKESDGSYPDAEMGAIRVLDKQKVPLDRAGKNGDA